MHVRLSLHCWLCYRECAKVRLVNKTGTSFERFAFALDSLSIGKVVGNGLAPTSASVTSQYGPTSSVLSNGSKTVARQVAQYESYQLLSDNTIEPPTSQTRPPFGDLFRSPSHVRFKIAYLSDPVLTLTHPRSQALQPYTNITKTFTLLRIISSRTPS